MSKRFETMEFADTNFDNLMSDISKVDIKLSDLDQIILDLKNNLNRAQQSLTTAAQADKVSLYKIINSSMDMLATYYQTYTKFMELKFRYRSEQDDLSFKTARFIQIELTKIGSATDANYYDMIEMLKKLSAATGPASDGGSHAGLPVDIQANIAALEDTDIYSTK